MSVRVSFTYEPNEPDDDHEMGVSADEYERVSDELMQRYAADDIEFARVDNARTPTPTGGRKKKG